MNSHTCIYFLTFLLGYNRGEARELHVWKDLAPELQSLLCCYEELASIVTMEKGLLCFRSTASEELRCEMAEYVREHWVPPETEINL